MCVAMLSVLKLRCVFCSTKHLAPKKNLHNAAMMSFAILHSTVWTADCGWMGRGGTVPQRALRTHCASPNRPPSLNQTHRSGLIETTIFVISWRCEFVQGMQKIILFFVRGKKNYDSSGGQFERANS